MTYTVQNFKTKKAFKAAVDAGEQVAAYQPGPFGPNVSDGRHSFEGPHYPEPHRWYATATVLNGYVQKVK